MKKTKINGTLTSKIDLLVGVWNGSVLDIETTGLNPVNHLLVGISFSWESGTGYYIPVRAAMGNVLPIEAVVEQLKPVMENPDVCKVGHNLKFDLKRLGGRKSLERRCRKLGP